MPSYQNIPLIQENPVVSEIKKVEKRRFKLKDKESLESETTLAQTIK
jgi:hypothetical protein